MKGRIATLYVVGTLVLVPLLASLALVATGNGLFLRIKSSSMHPNYCEGDIALVQISQPHARAFSTSLIGQVIVFTGPRNNTLIKRVAGAPSDRIEYSSHSVLRNGQLPYTTKVCADERSHGEPGSVIVPRGSVFALGDNWKVSEDSRQFGTVPETSIIGNVVMKIPLHIGSCPCSTGR